MNKKQKNLTNKGFSLVELIIVIAIMAVLVGVLAPQYLKYVNNSKVSTDTQNAQEIATAINVAISNQDITPGTGDTSVANGPTGTDTLTAVMTSAGTSVPASKLGGYWTVTYNGTDGVKTVKLTTSDGTYDCYPNPDVASTGISTLKK